MTEAGWTREKPTVSGLYWLRNNPKHAPEVVRVSVMSNSNVTVERIGSCDVTFEPDNAEFKGPITPDSYQQGRVAGLREAAIICRERGKPHDIEWWQAVSKKEISRQTAVDCAKLIEQAAQDEKGVGDGN